MKLAFTHALIVAGGVTLSMADEVATQVPVNATVAGGSKSTVLGAWDCDYKPPINGNSNWYYNSKDEGPYWCTANHDSKLWSMLNAYRSGGTQGVHWKYTDNPNDGDCLSNWTYYTSDGQTVIEAGIGRTTFNGDTRRWCGLPVYRTGGVLGKQWGYCVPNCGFDT